MHSGLTAGLTAGALRTSRAVLTRRQALSTARKTQARTNIGAGTSTFDPTTYAGALTAGTINGNTIQTGSGAVITTIKAASSQSFANATLADYTRLTLPVLASSSYWFEWELQFHSSAVTGGWKLAMTGSGTPAVDVGIQYHFDSLEAFAFTTEDVVNVFGWGSVLAESISGIVSDCRVRVFGTIATGAGDAGTLTLQLAQSTTAAGNPAVFNASSVLKSCKFP